MAQHRDAHEYLGEACLQAGDIGRAEAELRTLDSLCFLPCEQCGGAGSRVRPADPPYSPHQEVIMNITHAIEPWAPRALALLRIVAGYLFLQHGTAKLFGYPHVAMFDNLSVMSMIGLAGVLELVGGALIMIGLFVRPVAFVLSGEMAVAYFTAHAPRGNVIFPTLNQGEAAVLYCFLFLFLAAAGAGIWSIDAARRSAHPGPVV